MLNKSAIAIICIFLFAFNAYAGSDGELLLKKKYTDKCILVDNFVIFIFIYF